MLAPKGTLAAEGQQRPALVSGDTACPDPVAVEAEVFRLTSASRRAQYLPGASVQLSDSGDTYSIEIRRRGEHFVKSYSDPAHECEKRVRFAAVYVVMTLMPPDFDEEESAGDGTMGGAAGANDTSGQAGAAADHKQGDSESTTEQAAEKASGSDAAEPDREDQAPEADSGPAPEGGQTASWLAVELGLVGSHSLSSSEVPRIGTWGGEVLVQFGATALRGVAAFGVEPLAHFTLGDLRAKVSTLSARGGMRLGWDEGEWALAADAHLLTARRSVSSDGLPGAQAGHAWEWGGLLGFSMGYRWHPHVTPFLGLRASLFPAPSELVALPRGTLGTLPKVWLGAVLGARFSL